MPMLLLPSTRWLSRAFPRGDEDVQETPKCGDSRLAGCLTHVLGNNRLAAHEALQLLRREGYQGHVDTVSLEGDVEEAAARVARLASALLAPSSALATKTCVILAGETTVKFGQGGLGSGKGGRCSHMALLVARHLRGLDNWCLVSAGTDGQDGPCDSAGAFADGHTWLRGRNAGSEPEEAVAKFDSYTFFDKEGGLIRTGLTGTNVMDLHLLLCHPAEAKSTT